MSDIWKSAMPDALVSRAIEVYSGGCPKQQVLREFTTNCIEANAKTIYWGVDFIPVKDENGEDKLVPKMSVTDDGDGMAPQDMVTYLKDLHVTGKEFGLDKNLGIGAKITAAVNNKAGVLYLSWQNYKGYRLEFTYDEDSCSYGIKRLRDASLGEMAYVMEIPDTDAPGCLNCLKMPEMIKTKGSGTKVIFMGNKADDITSVPEFVGLSQGSAWSEYLQHRYYLIPDDLSIRTYDVDKKGYMSSGPHGPIHRKIRGVKFSLDDCSKPEERGTVLLQGGKVAAHWWIYTPQDTSSNRYIKKKGHIGILHKNEIYGLTSSKSLYSDFGLVFGMHKIFLLIELQEGRPNSSRTDILMEDNMPLSLDAIAKEFEQNLPPELDAIQQSGGKAISNNDKEMVEQELQRLLDMFETMQQLDGRGKGKTSPTHSKEAAKEGEEQQQPKEPKEPSGEPKEPNPPTPPPPPPDDDDEEEEEEEKPKTERKKKPKLNLGEEDKGDNKSSFYSKCIKLPEAKWSDDVTYADTAARFDQKKNLLIINSKFPEFEKLVVYIKNENQQPSKQVAIEEKVKMTYELQLCEYVAVNLSLMHFLSGFDRSKLDVTLSDEALTAVATMRIGLVSRIRNEIRKI